MGRIAPSPENVLRDFQNIPKFGKLAKDEKARVLAFEFGAPQPGQPFGSWAEYVHNLQVPAVKETRPNGDEVEVTERNWIGTFICLGREEVLAEFGFDKDVCPCCAHAEEDESFKPQRRHATNLVIYGTKPGSFDLREPWMVEMKPWTFSERTFRAIVELHSTWKDLRKHDLLITCTNPRYQNYDIQPAPSAAWIDPEYNPGPEAEPSWKRIGLQNIVVEVVKGSKLDDDGLSSMLGTRLGRAPLMEKVNTYKRELELVLARQSGGSAPSSAGPMDSQSINDMLGGNTPATSPAIEVPATEPAESTEEAPPAAPPAAPPVAAEPMSSSSIDDLLS